MLSDKDIDKLCHGRVVYADVYDSRNLAPAGVHWLILIDSDETIKNSNSYRVVGISHSIDDEPFHLPPPKYLLLDGFICCSWKPKVELAGIEKIGGKVFIPDMNRILETCRKADAYKALQGAKRPRKGS